ncbi:MAG: Rieske 2Fe-2S domain-containing protein [Vicinamibacteria bacterium]|nr:Rieske 2Fe-2S domain-containing protein [Vicinamibacteria bacterium]
MDRGEVKRVTIGVRDLSLSRALYAGLLGMRETGAFRFDAPETSSEAHAGRFAASLGLEAPAAIEGVDLEQPGTSVGAVRLVRVGDGGGERINEGARAFDHGYVKNLDFFTDDVRQQYRRFVEQGFEFLAPPLDYAVPWGEGAVATEAHLPTEDGVKISIAKMAGVPRIAMGRSTRETPFTEVAAATQIVKDFEASERFYCDVLDLVPAAPTVIEGELIAALRLPEGTRLRMSFLSGRAAAGGRVGIVAYEGPGVVDARDLKARLRAPYRGVLGLTFEVEDVEHATRKALALGASLRCAPGPQALGGIFTFGSTVVSPDGIPLLFEAGPASQPGAAVDGGVPPSEFSAICGIDELPPGAIREHRPKDGSPRLALANVAGQVFAFEDRCPHLGAPLSRGALRGRTLVCPWHGWMIDVPTGEVRGGRGAALRRCPARVRGGIVEVAPHSGSGA